jgi:Asp-tRNA(Asn)/Glu-tRNA(Gln) amidotransferase A subunit family amidase
VVREHDVARNLAGLPGLSLPLGGTPTWPGAVQLVAPSEEAVLRLAVQLEAIPDREVAPAGR